MSFGAKLKHFGLFKYSSLKEFGAALGKNDGYMQKIFTNKVTPKIDFLQKVRNLGCDIDWLLDDNQDIDDFKGVYAISTLPETKIEKVEQEHNEEDNTKEPYLIKIDFAKEQKMVVAEKNNVYKSVISEYEKLKEENKKLKNKLQRISKIISNKS